MTQWTIPMLTRRFALLGGAATPLGRSDWTIADDPIGDGLWSSFRSKFVTDEGRIVDNANGNVSHSEGQGWGLIFAASFNDKKTFDSIFRWTSLNLRRPHDRLHAWRYVPGSVPPVADLNNATDGDIFIAAALARAAAIWGNNAYAEAAEAISGDIISRLVRRVAGRLVLLPGISGFERPNGVVINISYYAFPFLTELARLAPAAQWETLLDHGVALITEGRFGEWMLPPDWLFLDRARHLQPAAGWPPRFSFDAIRIPLWLIWSRRLPPALYQGLRAFWTSFPDSGVPAWTDLITNEVPSYSAPSGIQAVARLAEAAATHTTPDLPQIVPSTAYYDAALILLSHLAYRESRDR